MDVYYSFGNDCNEDLLEKQIRDAQKAKGEGTFERLFENCETYTVK